MARVPTKTDEYRTAMTALIAERWRDLWKALPAVMTTDDPEPVHEMRIASRRLRSAMDAGEGAFPRKWFRRLAKAARSITSALGAVRDADVLLEALRRAREHADPAEWLALDHLIAQVARDQEAGRETMRAFLADIEAHGIRKESRRRFPRASSSKTGNKRTSGGKRRRRKEKKP